MYYPKSQITTNLYANSSDELVTKKGQKSYVGPYYLVSNGKKYAGKAPSSVSIELIPNPKQEVDTIEDFYNTITATLSPGDPDPTELADTSENDEDSLDLFLIKNDNIQNTYVGLTSPIKNRKVPLNSNIKPTNAEIKRGYYQKYYAKKTNESLFIEIDYNTFKLFTSGDPNMALDLYEVESITWVLKSKTKDPYDINKKTVEKLEFQKKWNGFTSYFNGRFGPSENPEDFYYTNGGVLVLLNRTNYIGYFHTTGFNKFATGKYPGDGGNLPLFQLNSSIPLIAEEPNNEGDFNFDNTNSPSSQSPTNTSSPSSGGGGGY